MPVYVCRESALEHYRRAIFPAIERKSQVGASSLDDAVSSLREINQLSLVGLGLEEPSPEHLLNVLVPSSGVRGRSKCVLASVWSGPIPKGAFRKVSEDAFVSSPEFLFLQMARTLDLIELIELGMELCGTYRRNAADDRTSYDQPILATPRSIAAFVEKAGPTPGTNRAKQALKHISANSASPFETIVYLLLCLPRRLGGYAFPKPTLNTSITLSKRGKRHTLRKSSSPDLFWRFANLDLECHGSVHELEGTRTEDSMRRKALERMGIEVIELTYAEVKDPALFRATVRRLATRLGVRLRARSEGDFASHEDSLRVSLLSVSEEDGMLWDSSPSQTHAPAFNDPDLERWLFGELPPEYESWAAFMGTAPDETAESTL